MYPYGLHRTTGQAALNHLPKLPAPPTPELPEGLRLLPLPRLFLPILCVDVCVWVCVGGCVCVCVYAQCENCDRISVPTTRHHRIKPPRLHYFPREHRKHHLQISSSTMPSGSSIDTSWRHPQPLPRFFHLKLHFLPLCLLPPHPSSYQTGTLPYSYNYLKAMPSDATLPGSQTPAVSAHPLRDRVQAHRALKVCYREVSAFVSSFRRKQPLVRRECRWDSLVGKVERKGPA